MTVLVMAFIVLASLVPVVAGVWVAIALMDVLRKGNAPASPDPEDAERLDRP